MKLNPYANVHNGAFIGLYPALLVAVLLMVHYFSGALVLPIKEGGLKRFQHCNSYEFTIRLFLVLYSAKS